MTTEQDDESVGTESDEAETASEATEVGVGAEAAESTAETDDSDGESDDHRRRFSSTWIVATILAVLLVASAGVTAWLYFAKYQPDTHVNEAAQNTVLKAAGDGTVALLSYSPDTLDADFSAAKSHLTGDFLSYYSQFTQDIVTPAAKQKAVKTSAAVIRKALVEMHPDSAVVLVFLNQVTTSKENPDGAYSTSAVKVSLQRHDNAWLISSFDPV